MQTFSEENYLKIIYQLERQGLKITPTAIAENLNNNPASVIDMLKKLGDKKLVSYDKTKGAKLSANGRSIAVAIIRKHRLWEVFLSEKLGYEWDQVHDIAEQLEHIQDSELADRLDKFLGSPEYDPHGDPIPSANGEMAAMNRIALEEAAVGAAYKVVGVKNTSPEFLQYLNKLGIGIGTKITVVEKIPFDGSLSIRIGKNSQVTVSKVFSQNLFLHE
jgi:DtxR family transcriptional regulator, Mn-dependent transcriptional regulator